MSPKITSLYHEYHALCGSPEAAATLVLAHVQADGQSLLGTPSDGLLNLKEAAAYLGYNTAGLRKIVKQKGIRYVQNGRGPIKFRQEWLDEFIFANEGGPKDIQRSPAQKRRPAVPTEPRFGFDPKLLRDTVERRRRRK